MRSGRASSCTVMVSLSLVLTLVWSCPAAASITAVGDIEPAYDGSDPWFLPTNVKVGATADANLAVSGGSQIRSYNYSFPLSIASAWDPGVTASLTVTGPGSLVNASTTTGVAGNASLLVADGATLSGRDAVLAQNAGSTGLATVTGPGSLWENGRDLEIGRGGDATLMVADGGTLTSAFGYLGVDAGSVGRVTVTGPNSLWDNSLDVTIGELGDGTLNISDGGRVVSDDVSAGLNYGGTGTINVAGPGSLLDVREHLLLASEGRADMVISNGGRVQSGSSEVAYWVQGVGAVTVTGPNSVWEAGESLTLGIRGSAHMVVEDGGRVVNETAHMAADSEGVAEALVTGSGSRWENSSTLFLGEWGSGTVIVTDGGALMTTGVVAGSEVGSVGTLLVTGPGTLLQGAPVLPITIPEDPPDANTPTHLYLEAIIGLHGTGNVTISDGARVTTEEGMVYVGYWPEAVGRLTVGGPNSVWEDAGTVHVGHFGSGTLWILDGGAVIGTNDAYIGTSYWPLLGDPTSSRGDVLVADPGSLWRVGGTLMVGDIGQGELLVSAGGRVESKWGYVNDLATVTGAGSLWQNERSLTVEGFLEVEAGGQVTDANAYVGSAEDSSALVQVTGAGSTWDNRVELEVGVAGWGTVSVEDGAYLTSRTGVLGVESTGDGLVAVDYPGSRWEILPDPNTGLGGDLSVGQAGYGTLQIGSFSELGIGGGTVAAKNAVVGAQPGSEGLITVIGEGSRLDIEEGFVIGAGGDAYVSVGEGGQVIAFDTRMATAMTGTAAASVTGPNSVWEIENFFIVGDAGQARLDILDGGTVTSFVGMVGYDPGSLGSVYVDGPNSLWENASLTVGVSGLANVVVTNGARVTSHAGVIALEPNSGGEVRVMDPNSVWENTGILTVGSSGYGVLRVADGGRLINGGVASLGEEAGSWAVATVDGPNSVWTNAGLVYVGGSSEGPGGTATLAVFNHGLVEANDVIIWPTGTVMGDGTLAGNDISVFGTIQPGASIGTLTIDGDLSLETDGVLEAEIDNSGHSDLLDVTGAFTLAGGTVRPIPVETIVGSHQYTIVEANSVAYIVVAGSSDVLSTALLDSDIVVGPESDPNTVLLDVAAVPFNDPNITRTANQRSLGAALEQIAVQEPNNEVTMALQQLPTDDAVRQAYDQLSGQTIPALAPVSVADTTKYMSMVSNRLRNSAGVFSAAVGLPRSPAGTGPEGMAGVDRLGVDAGRYGFAVGNGTPYLTDEPWAIWGKGYGLFGDRESESGVPGYDYRIYGGSFGLDYQFTERLLLGFTGGYSAGDIRYSSSRDRADVDSTHVGLYGRYDTPWWYFDAIGTYADLSYETRRFVDVLGERLDGEPSGSLVSGYFEVGSYRWLSERCLIQPLAAFQLSTLHLDSFTESGGTAALHFDDEHYESYRGSLGVKVRQKLFRHDDGCRASAELRGRWVHEFGDTQASLNAEFAGSPGVVFRVSDARLARDSAVLGAGLDTWFGKDLRAFLDYTAELNRDNTLQLVSAGLEYRW